MWNNKSSISKKNDIKGVFFAGHTQNRTRKLQHSRMVDFEWHAIRNQTAQPWSHNTLFFYYYLQMQKCAKGTNLVKKKAWIAGFELTKLKFSAQRKWEHLHWIRPVSSSRSWPSPCRFCWEKGDLSPKSLLQVQVLKIIAS